MTSILPSPNLNYDVTKILSGKSLEHHIEEDADKQDSVLKRDAEILEYAINNGLLSKLPMAIKLIAYGSGDTIAFNNKEGQLMNALETNGRQITHLCAVDILERYAVGVLLEARAQHRIGSFSAVEGDFIFNGRLAIKDVAGTCHHDLRRNV